MRIQSAQPSATPQQIEAHLRGTFPQYKVSTRGGMVLVGDGLATGVILKPSGPGGFELKWAFPSMGVQMLLSVSMVLTGIIPGLLAFLIVWLVVKGGVDRMKQEVATVISGGHVAPGVAGSAAGQGSSFAMIGGVLCFVMALLGLGSMLSYGGPLGGGFLPVLCWIGLGVGLVLRQSDDKRALQTGAPASGPGLLVIGISAALMGLLQLVGMLGSDYPMPATAWLGPVFWLAVGGGVIAAQFKAGLPTALLLRIAGGVAMLFGVLAIYDMFLYIGGFYIGLMTLLIVFRSLLWFGLGGMAFAHASTLGKGGSVPGAQQGYPQQPGYPQQQQPGYPQQQQPGYPQQQQQPGYPQQQQPGYPQQQQPGYPQQQQPGYPQQQQQPGYPQQQQQPGYPQQQQQPGYPQQQQPGYPQQQQQPGYPQQQQQPGYPQQQQPGYPQQQQPGYPQPGQPQQQPAPHQQVPPGGYPPDGTPRA